MGTFPRDGKKKTFTKGKIWITLKINVEQDAEKRFTKTAFWYQVKDFIIKYLTKKRHEQGIHVRYRQELSGLQNYMFKRIKMETQDYEYQHIAGVHRRGP